MGSRDEEKRGVDQRQLDDVQWKRRGPEQGGSPGARCFTAAQDKGPALKNECGGSN